MVWFRVSFSQDIAGRRFGEAKKAEKNEDVENNCEAVNKKTQNLNKRRHRKDGALLSFNIPIGETKANFCEALAGPDYWRTA